MIEGGIFWCSFLTIFFSSSFPQHPLFCFFRLYFSLCHSKVVGVEEIRWYNSVCPYLPLDKVACLWSYIVTGLCSRWVPWCASMRYFGWHTPLASLNFLTFTCKLSYCSFAKARRSLTAGSTGPDKVCTWRQKVRWVDERDGWVIFENGKMQCVSDLKVLRFSRVSICDAKDRRVVFYTANRRRFINDS